MSIRIDTEGRKKEKIKQKGPRLMINAAGYINEYYILRPRQS